MGSDGKSGIVAFLSDFGQRDGFVGAMKGAALAINPHLRFVDVSHEIAPRSIREGALVLSSVFDVFPPGTIFVAVVDPGVGGGRRALAARAHGRFVLAPDNGLADPILAADDAREIRSIVETRFLRTPIHPTFHGRDVFAPAAAHLSLGVPLAALGPAVSDPVRLDLPRPRAAGGGIVGEVLHVDRFGNLVSNLRPADLAPLAGEPPTFEVGGRAIEGIAETYAGGAKPLKVVLGSWGFFEVVAPDADASRTIGAGPGTEIRVTAGGVRA